MKYIVTLLIFLVFGSGLFANINYLDIDKISSNEKQVADFNYIRENQGYFDHWTPKWTYDKPKEELVKRLEDIYSGFSAITPKNTELFLLLGDISNYLYNLEDSSYYHSAVSNYESAVILSPKDYRCYWFLGYHFALSNVPDSAVINFFNAQNLLPSEQPADFWNEFAFTSAITNMPSHCMYAMDNAKHILGTPGYFERELGETVYKKRVAVNRDSFYKKKDIWTANTGEMSTFICRPLGIKILVDSSWQLSVYDYKKRQSAFIINPPALKSKKGTEIHYTIAILMKVANDDQHLDKYIDNLVSDHSKKINVPFSDKYEKMIAYEILDKTMYPDIGGGHLYMIGIERNAPKYPGLLLENPDTDQRGVSGQLTFYKAPDYKDRFKGKIFYAIMLDSCEDIHEQSLSIFKTAF